jgi:RNA polymerase sigma factor (sigma-70 family)
MEMSERIAAHIPRLRRYARALATSAVAPDDLVRLTLERAARQLHIGQAQQDLRVWLFSLLHEAYIDSIAGRGAASAPEATPPAAGATEAETFAQAVAALGPGQREIFLLVTLEDMSYEDIARALDIPVGTVMSRLSRAREKLRLLLMSQARLRAVK